MKRKKWHGSSTGEDFQQRFIQMLKDRNINFTQEKTLTNSKIRRKDKKVDIVLDDYGLNVELKSTTEKQALDYSLYDDGRNHKIKHHQIVAMDFIVIEYRPHEARVLSKIEFLKIAMNQKKNSFSWKDVEGQGKSLSEWLEGLNEMF